jgi:D-serine deaminase-like pyridoxal phosphate-dependent protein
VINGDYFQRLTTALREAGIHQPCLVLDLDRLDRNIATVKARMPSNIALRIVDKSLPCLPLIDRVRQAFGTKLAMTFHPQVTVAVLNSWPDIEVVYGKPMPVELARQVLGEHKELASRITWLIDTPERLAQYGALAETTGLALNICFEVDVGLHRGGLQNPDALREVLDKLAALPKLHCRGVMAYEAHIGHIPGFLGGSEKARRKSISLFRQFVAMLGSGQRDILNLGGSSTALTFDADVGANELSLGSAFVKPADFDVPSLGDLSPAVFIAAPVLKVVDVQLPGLDARSRFAQRLGLLPRRGLYAYGGKWMAKPAFPAGMKINSTIGHSTNQQFFALPDDASIAVDDYAFLRPTQSEFVLQQFGSIRIFSEGRIVDNWPALPFS